MGSSSEHPDLAALRSRLDEVDAGLVSLAAERQRLVSEIGRVKQGDGRQVRDFRREREVLGNVRDRARRLGLDETLAEDLLKRLIEASLTRQERERGRNAARGSGREALVIGGSGRMGGWLADFLENQGFSVLLADPRLADDGQRIFADWRDAPESPGLVVVACPIRISIGIIQALALRQSKALVVEVASVKSPLLDTLREAAASGLRICSAHPMFGPDTRLLAGRHVLLMDVGCATAVDEAEALFFDTMAEVTRIDLDQHDRLIAFVLGLSHALNIAFSSALSESGIAEESFRRVASTTFEKQLAVARAVAEENPDLYFEIQQLNRHGAEARGVLSEALRRLCDSVDLDRADDFRRLMERGRQYLGGL